MRLIDVDAFKNDYHMADECKDCQTPVRTCEYDRVYTKMDFCEWLDSAPTIEPRKKGKWLFKERREPVYDISGVKTWGIAYMCPECGFIHTVIEDFGQYVYCPNCGAEMRTPVETARDIVHEAINNSVWSDAVDTAKMHKIVDDKYAEIRGDANADAES